MKLKFEKWHGCQNDFIIIRLDNRQTDYVLPSAAKEAAKICSRNGAGIGADGLIFLHVGPGQGQPVQDFEISIINSDGSVAKNCGNGLRCVAASIYRENLQSKLSGDLQIYSIQVRNGAAANCQILPGSHESKSYVSLNFEAPSFLHLGPSGDLNVKSILRTAKEFNLSLESDGVSIVNLGNNHLVLFLDSEPSHQIFAQLAKKLQNENQWDGINVHAVFDGELQSQEKQLSKKLFDQTTTSRLNMIPWERGVGFTQACGSGAVATVAAACDNGLTETDKWITVGVPGGFLFVKIDGDSKQPSLAGPAELSFLGEFDL